MPVRRPADSRSFQTRPDADLMTSPLKALSIGLVAAVAGIAGLVTASFFFKPDAPEGIQIASGTLLPAPRAIPEFTLSGTDGKPFTKASLEGKWSVIFVGFTHCPDVCPNTLGLLKTVHKKLQEQSKPVQITLISVDPERDTPEVLTRYVNYFDPSFVGATGDKTELDKLASAMGFIYMKSPGATPETYTIDHSSALILINPQAQVAGYFTQPLKVDGITTDLGALIGGKS